MNLECLSCRFVLSGRYILAVIGRFLLLNVERMPSNQFPLEREAFNYLVMFWSREYNE